MKKIKIEIAYRIFLYYYRKSKKWYRIFSVLYEKFS